MDWIAQGQHIASTSTAYVNCKTDKKDFEKAAFIKRNSVCQFWSTRR